MESSLTKLEQALKFWDGTQNEAREIVKQFGSQFTRKEIKQALAIALKEYSPKDRGMLRKKMANALAQKPHKTRKAA